MESGLDKFYEKKAGYVYSGEDMTDMLAIIKYLKGYDIGDGMELFLLLQKVGSERMGLN